MPNEAAAVRAQIGMVSHKALLYDNLTAKENLLFFAKLYGLKEITHIDNLLKQVGLEKRADSLVRTFSRGMQQRLSIARALLHNPHVLLFDEPYTGLDQDASLVLDDLLLEAHQAGHSILMASHQLERAARLANRIVIISRGNIAYDDTRKLSSSEIGILYTEKTGASTAR
jgi:heme exporter protein A